MPFEPIPRDILEEFKTKICVMAKRVKYTRPGCIAFLLFGEEPSRQSLLIRMGKPLGEELPKTLINSTEHLKMEECGIVKLNESKQKKDFDLIWKNEATKTVFYRESKGNMELDTEKLPATISKVKKLHEELTKKYPNYTINSGIFNWSIYEREDAELNTIKTCEENNVKVEHFKDFIHHLKYTMSKEEFYAYFRDIGTSCQ